MRADARYSLAPSLPMSAFALLRDRIGDSIEVYLTQGAIKGTLVHVSEDGVIEVRPHQKKIGTGSTRPSAANPGVRVYLDRVVQGESRFVLPSQITFFTFPGDATAWEEERHKN